MNLICFPHYTCGGLLCDILSDRMSTVDIKRTAIDSFEHSLGKIGDSNSVFDDFNEDVLFEKLNRLNLPDNTYIGTHCWPGNIDITRFNKVFCITTATHQSRVYRWTRCFYNYYQQSQPWQLTGIELIDKQRETAKNYLKPFNSVPGAINLEFSEIVNETLFFKQLVGNHDYKSSLERWKNLNKFLYTNDFWNSEPVQRYYEAEYEVNLQQRYVYE